MLFLSFSHLFPIKGFYGECFLIQFNCLRAEDIVCCADCKASWGKFVICELGYINNVWFTQSHSYNLKIPINKERKLVINVVFPIDFVLWNKLNLNELNQSSSKYADQKCDRQNGKNSIRFDLKIMKMKYPPKFRHSSGLIKSKKLLFFRRSN